MKSSSSRLLQENMLQENMLPEKMLQENMLQENMLQENMLQENMLPEKITEENPALPTRYLTAEARRRTVLVAVVNNVADLQRAASEGWYRIPQRTAPRRIGADFLAFYQTGAFQAKEEAQTVTYYAPTRRYQLLTRRELLP
ncbi:MAG: hypothetical protein KDE31_00095, partial [Caldilineaceae bacterium]|nr:hypothetical protein [Caldilineaceae bacterium]